MIIKMKAFTEVFPVYYYTSCLDLLTFVELNYVSLIVLIHKYQTLVLFYRCKIFRMLKTSFKLTCQTIIQYKRMSHFFHKSNLYVILKNAIILKQPHSVVQFISGYFSPSPGSRNIYGVFFPALRISSPPGTCNIFYDFINRTGGDIDGIHMMVLYSPKRIFNVY